MGRSVRIVRLVGLGLVAVGVLAGGVGLLLDASAPACGGGAQGLAGIADGGCPGAGPAWFAAGAALALVGAVVSVATAYRSWGDRSGER